MELISFDGKIKEEIVLALGFFDAVHLGHQLLLNKANIIKKDKNIKSAVFTFKNNPFEHFRKGTKEVLTFEERITVFKKMGIDYVIYANMNHDFMTLSKEKFIDIIKNNFNVKAIVCGSDYTYGKHAEGNADTLKDYCKTNNIDLFTENLLHFDGNKISSTEIRKCISSGNVENANKLLGYNYFVTGTVVHCAGRGKTMGFPTANIILPKNKMPLKNAVYLTIIYIDNKKYKAITNAGERPTFDEYSYIIESYIYNFNENIYDKTIKVEFVKKLREIKNFNSVADLQNQLLKDKKELSEFKI